MTPCHVYTIERKMQSEESLYINLMDTVVYVTPIVDRFVSCINRLDCWSGKVQCIEFCSQDVMLEAEIEKTEDEIRLCNLYAMTINLDALDDLETLLTSRLEDAIDGMQQSHRELVNQAIEIASDREHELKTG
ncbi:MAG: hypothetical protein ACK5MK_12590 [Dysgonomonas sp.]